MKKILAITMSLFVNFGVNACGHDLNTVAISPQEEANNENDLPDKGEILIVYFSRAGENYAVGTVSVGNTAMMADYIQKETGGTLFEVVPVVPYPEGYEATKLISQQEREKDLRPAIKHPLENIDKYSVVFIGAPIWYGEPPMIMRTFYEAYPQLAGKTLIPFGTDEGSGIASCATLIKRYFPKATIKESLGLRGAEVRNSPAASQNAVKNWIDKLNIKK